MATNVTATTNSSANPSANNAVGIKETITSLIIAFMLAFLFRGFVIEGFQIPTGSMAPTLMGKHTRLVNSANGYDWPIGPWNYIDGVPLSQQDWDRNEVSDDGHDWQANSMAHWSRAIGSLCSSICRCFKNQNGGMLWCLRTPAHTRTTSSGLSACPASRSRLLMAIFLHASLLKIKQSLKDGILGNLLIGMSLESPNGFSGRCSRMCLTRTTRLRWLSQAIARHSPGALLGGKACGVIRVINIQVQATRHSHGTQTDQSLMPTHTTHARRVGSATTC